METKLMLSLFLCLLIGCNPYIAQLEQKKKQALQNCLTNVPSAVEFTRCFPDNCARLTRFADDRSLQTLAMETALFQRYILRMQIPVTFDQSKTNLVKYGVPKFVLDKVESIGREEDGRFHINLNSDDEIPTSITLTEWKKIVESDGDLTVLERPILKDKPVQGFNDYWRSQNPILKH